MGRNSSSDRRKEIAIDDIMNETSKEAVELGQPIDESGDDEGG